MGGGLSGQQRIRRQAQDGPYHQGSSALRTALIEAALAATRTKDTYPAAHYQRVKRNRGHKKAVVAVAHTILVIIWHLLDQGVDYHELGGDFFVARDANSARRRAVRQLERLGHKVTLEPATAA
ncbi:MAG: hypothetical protein M3256_13975 [Actinomycetota bacterium]|nr:hypothetical protein [Actinomycetota bacterium]